MELRLPLCILLLCLTLYSYHPAHSQGNETDRLALMHFRQAIDQDPFQVFRSWNSSVHHCAWRGVLCGRRHPDRVVGLNLTSQGLVGSLSPHIGNLSFLRYINLRNNSFHGQIPHEISHLFRLQVLRLSNNSFGGHLHANLSRCSNLAVLNLIDNKLVGSIPEELGSLRNLVHLGLNTNNLTGTIPASLGNLSSLYGLYLAENDLEGQIPESLTQLLRLQRLLLMNNKLTGPVPYGLYNISTMEMLELGDNQLTGTLPSDIGLSLPNLYYFHIYSNNFSGSIPPTLSNASSLEQIVFYDNHFTGLIPKGLGRLAQLEALILTGNLLKDDLSFISHLANCSKLSSIAVDGNFLRGSVPNSVANLSSTLWLLGLSGNELYGILPPGIENLSGLRYLLLDWNYLSGPIHVNFSRLQLLERVYLRGNQLTGSLPSSIGNLTRLSLLEMSYNDLQGSIPPSLGNCQSLTSLKLAVNNLSGVLPPEFLNIPSLSVVLNLSFNRLTGFLPSEVGLLKNLEKLDLSNNRFVGKIPDSFAKCLGMQELYLGGNSLEGEIPQALNAMQGLQVLDFSSNNLSGKIPDFLSKIRGLAYLNLSFNRLHGEVPVHGIFLNASAVSVIGNNGLCGGIAELRLPSCTSINSKKKKSHFKSLWRIIIPVVVAATLLSIALAVVWYRRKMSRKEGISFPSLNNGILRISYAELFKATNGFSRTNIIGLGSYGSVYKGILDRAGVAVAVKVLNLTRKRALRSFMSECQALGSIRHRNLLKLLSVCSSVDFQGNDFKALIYEFMANGNLENWLHGDEDAMEGETIATRRLQLLQRLDIAIDTASAVEYLHNGSPSTIIHGDLKPSNVLLNDEMIVHIGDFGLARIVSTISGEDPTNPSSSSAIKGSIGYVAPEYGMGGRFSIEGDVYSYGIILLEMFTGKRPTTSHFKDGLSLHVFVKRALPGQVMEVMDQNMQEEGRNDAMEDCITSIMRIGVQCSMESPEDRMKLNDVISELKRIKSIYSNGY